MYRGKIYKLQEKLMSSVYSYTSEYSKVLSLINLKNSILSPCTYVKCITNKFNLLLVIKD